MDTSGPMWLIVSGAAFTTTGDYEIAIQRLSTPVGCTPLRFGTAPTATTISAAGEMDCYTFTGTAGDQIRVRVAETASPLVATQEVVRPNGTTVCGPTSATDQTCGLDTTGTGRIIVHDNAGTNTGGYPRAVQQ